MLPHVTIQLPISVSLLSNNWYGGERGGGWEFKEEDGGFKKKDFPENHILLFTIVNPVYPITVDVLHTITQAFGEVLRIVIFKKHGVQAMVEFANVDMARAAKEGLDGADIYSGCCTLKIEYAKPTRLNVHKNDSETWDYTTPTPGADSQRQRPAPLLPEPAGGPQGFRGSPEYGRTAERHENGFGVRQGRDGATPRFDYEESAGGAGGRFGGEPSRSIGGGRAPGQRFGGQPGGPPVQSRGSRGVVDATDGPQEGAVLMVYGLNMEKMNADRLFNLLCLYGNVFKIKFLKTKEGSAMVQMGDAPSVDRAIFYLNGLDFFNTKMNVNYSKQAFLADVSMPYDLPDGTPSFKSFVNSKNNRFLNSDMASKNRLQPPCKVLHFYNTPPGLTEEDLRKVFEENGTAFPADIRLLQNKSEKSSSGHLEFSTLQEAVEALVICNHIPLSGANVKWPYTTKLCFSTPRPGQAEQTQ
ncbi:heterogeneous nuclear ribonucleoprotein L-like isoform X2 [Daphnia pulex]|uniref:heterogeneous nuclear ribonucleoprotein L-like isoform X2 n=1 Tax=Daphnia pulex TaxID=6669 RepID=UPI001EDFFF81|nr:heterogeneous nuclear ribonucleoprotein L-like isoform X2 [Daphnia pulex]XP_046632831.1 heterogeneous nuclear ribonucleoprotein L-like isoform X2 [Daphnia pulicaria]